MDLLQNGHWSAGALAQQLHVTPRTIYRDLEAIAEAQWLVEKAKGGGRVQYHRRVI
jgi:DeoR/GlpR family transcriptional regulator of sugar metabolism